jgi:hypothetical protein
MVQLTRNSNAETSSKRTAQLPSRPKSKELVPSKLDSTFTLTSSVTRVESTYTRLVLLKVDTPLKSLVGDKKPELTSGSLPTHGTPVGVNKDSSESKKVKSVLTQLSSLATQLYDHINDLSYLFINFS